VGQVAQGRHWITFGGTAGTIGRALGTQIRRYRVDGREHFANATEPRIPAALEPVIAGFDGLDDFRPQPFYIKARIAPNFNIGGTANYLAPDDIATIYNINPLYKAGFDGTGQKIVIVGDSALDLTDIRAFRQTYNLPAKDPQRILVGTDPGTNGDMVESDLDLEWAGAVARNADLIYVYAIDVNAAAQYAVDRNLAPVISMSFGGCEVLSSVGLRAVAQQANAQGITWVASSGDTGSAQCDNGSPTQEAVKGPTVSVPASYPEVTAVGGTTLNEGTGTYWNTSNSATGGSALSYIPEVAWNDAAQDGALVAAGGGASANFAKPGWQSGPGVPNDNARDLPDIAFAASANHDGYLIVTFGQIDRVGGTSAPAPVFAGMLGLLNQYLVSKGAQSQPGLGNINPILYRMAQSTTGVFHDVTTGDIKVPCALGSPGCTNGLLGYSAGPGYDLATGLGSADAFHLVTEWSIGKASSTAVTASAGTLNAGDKVTLTATVTAAAGSASGSTTPSGTVAFLVNDVNIGTGSLTASGSSSSSSANLSTTALALAPGNGTVNALYSGDSVFAGSSGSANVSIKYPATGSFIVVSINPDPTPQTGPVWPFIITLSERAGVATTLTGFSEDGQSLPVASFFSTAKIPANGSISTSVTDDGFVPPAAAVFKFTGADANGQ
ncbi:MAG TPA: Ig-like domain repeat protein, partial [Candidatus Solibacter sp.]|nr:Ig-like domain repeat protein [Candidatus Solibacter sp.]